MLIIMLNFMLEKCAYPALCMFEHDNANMKSELFYQRPNKLNN